MKSFVIVISLLLSQTVSASYYNQCNPIFDSSGKIDLVLSKLNRIINLTEVELQKPRSDVQNHVLFIRALRRASSQVVLESLQAREDVALNNAIAALKVVIVELEESKDSGINSRHLKIYLGALRVAVSEIESSL